MNPNDHKTLAQLIAAYSKFDANKAKMYPYQTINLAKLFSDFVWPLKAPWF